MSGVLRFTLEDLLSVGFVPRSAGAGAVGYFAFDFGDGYELALEPLLFNAWALALYQRQQLVMPAKLELLPRRRDDQPASTHRENAAELRRRVLDDSGLGLPVPKVSTEIAHLLVDLLVELEATVLELELNRSIGDDLRRRLQESASS